MNTAPARGPEAASGPLRAAPGPCWPETDSWHAPDPDGPGRSRLSALVGLLVVALGLVVRLRVLVRDVDVHYRVLGRLLGVLGAASSWISSITARGALSPLRGPILVIRV